MSRVADRFARAARTYESATPIQRQAAALLAERVLASGAPAGARVAEFGCGTGYLAQALAPRLNPSLWIATDIAPAMVLAARARTPLAASIFEGLFPAMLSCPQPMESPTYTRRSLEVVFMSAMELSALRTFVSVVASSVAPNTAAWRKSASP